MLALQNIVWKGEDSPRRGFRAQPPGAASGSRHARFALHEPGSGFALHQPGSGLLEQNDDANEGRDGS